MRTATPLPLIPLVALLALAGCQADLRPESLAERVAPRDEPRGRQILQRAAAAQHGPGARPWTDQRGVRVDLVDTFSGVVGWVARPWPSNPQHLTYHFMPGRDGGVATFGYDGEEIAWGLHEWNAWTRTGAEPAEYEDNDDLLFWLPTLQYFLEMGFRLPEGGFVDYAGEELLSGELHDVVYLTWVSYEPNDAVDQYVAYFSQETGLLRRCDFTVRDKADFLVGTVLYSDYRPVGSYVLPHRLEIGPEPPDDLLHVYEVTAWEPDAPLARSVVAPEPDRPPRDKP